MLKKVPMILAMALCTTNPLALQAAEGAAGWAYEGELGPEHWGDLSPDYVQCKVGVNQSPIDIVAPLKADLPPLELDYPGQSIDLVNNGHTAQINVEPGNYLRVGGEAFELLQFHIHVPSEHRIDGKQFIMEVHYVHRDAQGHLAVVAILFDEGENPPNLTKYMDSIPSQVNTPVSLKVPLADMAMMKMDKDYFRYNGSLTTPPCSEGVRWFVLKNPGTIAGAQRDRFNELIGDDARGPQPVNARPVLR